MQTQESKHKKKLERVLLGPTEQDLKQWLLSIEQLKPYAAQFEDAKVTGETMLAITSEEALADCGVSIDAEVDRYCLLLNLARVRAHAREQGRPRTTDHSKAPTKTKRRKGGKGRKPLAARDAALDSVEMESVGPVEPVAGPSERRPVQRGVC